MLPARPGVTKANFDRIEEGMNFSEVRKILGGDPVPNPTCFDFSGPTERLERTLEEFGIYTWFGDDIAIVEIRFRNNLVESKTFRIGHETMLDKLRRRCVRSVPNAGQGICWIRSNKSGTRLYTTDTTTNQVSVYDASDPEFPVEIQTLTLQGVGNAFQISLSENGKSIYTISQRTSTSLPTGQGNVLHILSVRNDGTVDETGTPITFNVPIGTRPQGVAVVDR